jgi:hypothetical protein
MPNGEPVDGLAEREGTSEGASCVRSDAGKRVRWILLPRQGLGVHVQPEQRTSYKKPSDCIGGLQGEMIEGNVESKIRAGDYHY